MSAVPHRRIETWDYGRPDFSAIFRERERRLRSIRADTEAGGNMLANLKVYYAHNPADFINDWAVTIDPRVTGKGQSAVMPFVLFSKQRELIEWIMDRIANEEPGIVEKSRDIGASWVAMSLMCALCIFRPQMMFGIGSAKEDKVDRTGDPDTLFFKAREFMRCLPVEFRGGWTMKNSAHMRLVFPETGSSITGEAGDNIGRGGRKLAYFIDESAHLDHPYLVDASLASTTNCRIDMSSVAGMANSFAERRHSGKIKVFTFRWTDDPRKDAAWYKKYLDRWGPVVTAQEVDINYSASIDMQLIRSEWVQAAVDAHKKLGGDFFGRKLSALDVADSGMDRNAWSLRNGVVLIDVNSWSGNDSDIHATAERAAMQCDQAGANECIYDSIGVGAGVKGAGRIINEQRKEAGKGGIIWNAYSGAGAVAFPEQKVIGDDGTMLDVKNGEFFHNKAAQDWWALRFRFMQTWRAIAGKPFSPQHLISLDSGMDSLTKLVAELTQPQYEFTANGKVKVAKAPEGTASPNMADAVRMVYSVQQRVFRILPEELKRL